RSPPTDTTAARARTPPPRSRSPRRRQGRSAESRGRDAVGVEDALEIPQCGQQRAEGLHVADLGRVPVLRELILDDAAVADDVRAVLGERPRNVLEQPRAIPGVDRELHTEALRRDRAVPLDRREPLRAPPQRL